MISDENKHISSIFYNHLNLPAEINLQGQNKIFYLYNANGEKVMKRIKATDTTVAPAVEYEHTTLYLDGFQYTDGALDFIVHPEGFVRATMVNGAPVFNYAYNIKDHQGNVWV